MFKNVLVGVDGRPGDPDAIAFACRLLEPGGRLTLAHVHRGELTEQLDDSHTLLEAERVEDDVLPELVSVVSASPGRGLHQQAEEQGADLVVVGSCSRGAFGRATLGDDTRAALNGAPCAIAIASRGYAEGRKPFAVIGVGYDGSAESVAALELARELAARSRATVCALEVVSIPSVSYTGFMPPGIGNSAEVMLEHAGSHMKELADVDGRAVYGLAGEQLAAFGDEVDVLVVGSRGYGPARRLVLGSTCNYLERHARCPLVVLPRVASTGPAREREHRGEPILDRSGA